MYTSPAHHLKSRRKNLESSLESVDDRIHHIVMLRIRKGCKLVLGSLRPRQKVHLASREFTFVLSQASDFVLARVHHFDGEIATLEHAGDDLSAVIALDTDERAVRLSVQTLHEGTKRLFVFLCPFKGVHCDDIAVLSRLCHDRQSHCVRVRLLAECRIDTEDSTTSSRALRRESKRRPRDDRLSASVGYELVVLGECHVAVSLELRHDLRCEDFSPRIRPIRIDERLVKYPPSRIVRMPLLESGNDTVVADDIPEEDNPSTERVERTDRLAEYLAFVVVDDVDIADTLVDVYVVEDEERRTCRSVFSVGVRSAERLIERLALDLHAVYGLER